MKPPADRGFDEIESAADADRDVLAYAVAWSEGVTLAESMRSVRADEYLWIVSPWRSPRFGVRVTPAEARLARALALLRGERLP